MDICLNEGNIRERFLMGSEGVTKAQLKTGFQNDVAKLEWMNEGGQRENDHCEKRQKKERENGQRPSSSSANIYLRICKDEPY